MKLPNSNNFGAIVHNDSIARSIGDYLVCCKIYFTCNFISHRKLEDDSIEPLKYPYWYFDVFRATPEIEKQVSDMTALEEK